MKYILNINKEIMKKIFAFLISSIVLFSIWLNNVSASNQADLYKAIILSKAKIKQDFGEDYNKIIWKYFEKLRISQDISKVNELNSRLEKILEEYSKRWISATERNHNLILNLYYRTKILKDYHLKNISPKTTNSNSNIKNNEEKSSIENTSSKNPYDLKNDSRVKINN